MLAQFTTSSEDIENNIFQMTGGTVFDVPAADQVQFASNYNMFYLLAGATMADWGGADDSTPGITVATFDDWMFGTGLDRDSLSGNPKFLNPGGGRLFLVTLFTRHRRRRSDFALRSGARKQRRPHQSGRGGRHAQRDAEPGARDPGDFACAAWQAAIRRAHDNQLRYERRHRSPGYRSHRCRRAGDCGRHGGCQLGCRFVNRLR